jgi:type I restriction enzyme S subunit
MKDSGINWIGKIPSHWGVRNAKWLFSHRKERARKGEQQLAATQKYGVIPQINFMDLEGRRVVQVFLDFEILKHVEAGDFVMSMRSFQGGIEYSGYSGCVSSAYVALKPGNHIFSPYFKYLLKSTRYIEALQSTSNLVRDGQALRFDNFAMVNLLLVPLAEQKQIADYLDAHGEKINSAIEIKERQIAALKEYKTNLINAAVTGKIKVV